MRVQRCLVCVVAFALLAGCEGSRECGAVTKQAAGSVGTAVVCVLEPGPLGATVGNTTSVLILPNTDRSERGALVFRGESVDSIDVRWVNPRRLEIVFAGGRMYSAVGFWSPPQSNSSSDHVRVVISDATPL